MVAFIVSISITALLSLAAVPMAKRRPIGTPLSWGEAMFASTYVFAILFLAYGVVPHSWLTWADNELKWRSDKLVYGPWDIFKPQAKGGHLPFTINYLVVQHIIVSAIYGILFSLHMVAWVAWQKRGKTKSAEVEVSSYGRPLARKA